MRSIETTLLRVVGRLLSLDEKRYANELSRLLQYVKRNKSQLDTEIYGSLLQTEVAKKDLAQIYAELFERQRQNPVSAKMDWKTHTFSNQVDFVSTRTETLPEETTSGDVEISEAVLSETEVRNVGDASDYTVDSTCSEEKTTSDASDVGAEKSGEAEVCAGPSDDGVQNVEGSESVVVVEDVEPEEDKLREKLLKRFRNEQQRKYRPVEPTVSRWEFWHQNVGLKTLNDWLLGADIDVEWQSSLQSTIDVLASVEILTIADLVLTPPKNHEKFPFFPIDKDLPEGMVSLRGVMTHRYIEVGALFKRWIVKLAGKDGTAVTCRWVGRPPRGWHKWRTGSTIGLVGEIGLENGFEMVNPEPIGLDGRGSGLLPIYALDGCTESEMRDVVGHLLSDVLEFVQDSLPKEIVESSGVLSLEDALREAHFPSNQSFKGHSRFAFEEVFLYHIGKRLNSRFVEMNGVSTQIYHSSLAQFSWVQNTYLNDAQELVLSEIRRDMLSNEPMRRMLQGDVGSGKPMVAMFAALSLFELKQKQVGKSIKRPLVVYLCDDDLSAERRFVFLENAFKMLGLPCKLLTNKPNKAEMNLLESEGGLVVVTEEILRTRLQSVANIRLVIVEENQNFGQNIPYAFIKRSPSPDLLVFTPTPQPLHVLETVYADFALSTIVAKHRLPTTQWCRASDRSTIYQKMQQNIQQGRQGIIVWPMIKGKEGFKDAMDVQQALQAAGAIKSHYLPEARIGVYCSSMKKEERFKVFQEFQNQRIDVLLCSTIIEDTPSVGNTTMLIVERAETADGMRLHRLRGHLVKSHYPATCAYIVSDDTSEEALLQVELVCAEEDGFALAEKLPSTLQNEEGLDLNWATETEISMRIEARRLAHMLSLKDLRRCRWPLLNNAVKHWWTEFEIPNQKVTTHKKRFKRRR